MRYTLRDVWDRLGIAVAVSLTWSAFFTVISTTLRYVPFPQAWLRVALPFVAAAWLAAPTAGAYQVAHLIAERDEVSYFDYWSGAWRLAGAAIRLALLHAAVAAIIGVNVLFYANLRGVAGGTAALLCVYAAVFCLMNAVYHFPILVAQELGVFDEPERRARRGVMAAVRRAFYLAMGEPAYTLRLLIVVLAFAALMLVTAVPFALIGMSSLSLLTTYATRGLLVKYGVLPAPLDQGTVADEVFRIS